MKATRQQEAETITPQQRKALRKWERMVAQELIYEGVTMNMILEKKQIDVNPTMEMIHMVIIKPLVKAMYDKDSTEDLEPKQVNEVYVQADRFMRNHFNVGIEFPCLESVAT